MSPIFSDAEKLLGHARQLFIEKQYEAAIVAAERALSLQPKNAFDFYQLIGLSWESQLRTLVDGDERGVQKCYSMAAKAYEKAHALNPADEKLLATLAVCYEMIDEYKGHADIFQKAANSSTTDNEGRAGFYYSLGRAIEAEAKTPIGQAGDYAKMEDAYKHAWALDPKGFFAIELGEFYFRNRFHRDVGIRSMLDSLSKAITLADHIVTNYSAEDEIMERARALLQNCNEAAKKFNRGGKTLMDDLKDDEPEPGS